MVQGFSGSLAKTLTPGPPLERGLGGVGVTQGVQLPSTQDTGRRCRAGNWGSGLGFIWPRRPAHPAPPCCQDVTKVQPEGPGYDRGEGSRNGASPAGPHGIAPSYRAPLDGPLCSPGRCRGHLWPPQPSSVYPEPC
ncbi:hypothetical protein VULLAG_LOCUS1042 [Vulpes lagopus]